MSRLASPNVIRALEAEDWRDAVRSVTAAEAEAILADIAGRNTPCTMAEAAQFARDLISLYPSRDLGNPDAYAAAVTTLFASHPRDFVKRVCNPVTGIPSRLKFFPVIADLAEALRAEADRRSRIAANARCVLDEAEKRRKEAEEEARWKAARPSAEERARRVQEIIKGTVRSP